MALPDVENGRGAFSTVGKDNGKRYYIYVPGKPEDGSTPTINDNYQAVHLGVKAIQARINSYNYSPALIVDGTYGPKTVSGVEWIQVKLGFTGNNVDGIAGPGTCRALWRDLLIWFGGVHHVPASQLYGFMMLESVGDPGALGFVSPADRGLNQINEKAHPDISDEQAFSPPFSIEYTTKRLGIARTEFSGKSVELKNYCAIAQHNSPVAAEIWYRDGKPPLGPVIYQGKTRPGWPNIQKYVYSVLTYAANFK
jgi:peptidoglycan hydrolase-like protein with peptidoglycan-binding domain